MVLLFKYVNSKILLPNQIIRRVQSPRLSCNLEQTIILSSLMLGKWQNIRATEQQQLARKADWTATAAEAPLLSRMPQSP